MRWTTKEEPPEPGIDRDAWERDTLAAVQKEFRGEVYRDVRLEEARLEGSYPMTCLVVVAGLPFPDRRGVFTHAIWDACFEFVPGMREHPERLGADIAMWILEDLSPCYRPGD